MCVCVCVCLSNVFVFSRFDNIPVEVTGNKPPAAIQTFDELLLPDTLKSNIARAEFTKPTPVQKYGMPIILTGRDIMACAQTGSGKTVRFYVFTDIVHQFEHACNFLRLTNVN